MMNLEVRAIMTKNPEVASPNQTIEELSKVFIDSGAQQMPVVENGQLIGLITSSDVWRKTNKEDRECTLVKDIMTKSVIKITPKDKVGTAAELFADKRFKMLPVVNLNNELKGIVTAFDVIKASFNEEYPRPILYQEAFTN